MHTRNTIMALRQRPDAVLFDWDNTLMDHDKLAQPVFDTLIADLGSPPYPTVDEMNKAWARSQEECCRLYFKGYTPEDVRQHFHKLSEELPVERATWLEGAKETLDELRAKDVPMAIVSNKPEALLLRELEHLGVKEYFQVIRGDRGDGILKPDPKMAIQTLQEMKIPLGNSWFVGDMMADAGAARSDGFQRFLIGTRHRAKVEREAIGSDPAGRIIMLDSIALLKDFAAAIPETTREYRGLL